METHNSVYRGRFAPSPSGPLHFGSLVAAMGSYLDARHNRGVWLVRMEDLDPPREQPGAADDILRTLEAFGFEWDEAVLYQSQRAPAYLSVLSQLIEEGLAFSCGCSRSEIARAGRWGIDGPIYPGTCRNGLPAGRAARAFRIRTQDRPTIFHDRVYGQVSQNLSRESGDFVIRRADGLFAYQLAVVVDDDFQGITHIVRGSDLLFSTPRQIYLRQLLDLPTPGFAHLPLALDEQGRKLSKQHRSRPVTKENPLPALIAALEFLGQPLPNSPLGGLSEFWEWATAHWTLSRVPGSGRTGDAFGARRYRVRKNDRV